MAGVVKWAQAKVHRVLGFDQRAYPPMCDQLANAGIEAMADVDALEARLPEISLAVIGNFLSRGHPLIEQILNRGVAYCSGPA